MRFLFLAVLAFLTAPAAPFARAASGDAQFGAQVGAALAQVQAQPRDGWNFGSAEGRKSVFFWDFKYFDFHDSEASGNIAFFTAAPEHSGQMVAIAHLYTGGQIQTYRKAFDLSCVHASQTSAELSLCDGGGIQVLAPDHYKITLGIGPAAWELDVRGQESGEDTSRAKLDGWLPWEMFWNPVFVRAAVSGDIRIGDKTLQLHNAAAYHDRNWGRWYPADQPYRWLHFSGSDSTGAPLDVLLGDFYKNKTDASVLTVQTSGGSRAYHKGEFDFAILAEGRAKTLRFGFKDAGEAASVETADPEFTEGDHRIPTEFAITTKDGSFSLRASTLFNDSTGPRLPALLKPFVKDFAIDEQSVKIHVEYRAPSGDRRRSDGVGEFQTIGE